MNKAGSNRRNVYALRKCLCIRTVASLQKYSRIRTWGGKVAGPPEIGQPESRPILSAEMILPRDVEQREVPRTVSPDPRLWDHITFTVVSGGTRGRYVCKSPTTQGNTKTSPQNDQGSMHYTCHNVTRCVHVTFWAKRIVNVNFFTVVNGS